MNGIVLIIMAVVSSLALTACGSNPRLPQGTLVKEENTEIQKQVERLQANEVATIAIGNEHVTLAVLKTFWSTDNIFGVGGGDPCKAYKLTTKDNTEEVGVLCKEVPFGKKWGHRPWREWFRSL